MENTQIDKPSDTDLTLMNLRQLQEYTAQVCHERGFDSNSDLGCFLLLSEETGELAKAIRKRLNLFQEKVQPQDNIGEELADVLSYLLELANRFGVDLGKELSDKEKINSQRQWI